LLKNNKIQIKGARQHNLKGIDVDIPKGIVSVVTGPSGSGKSSLAFNTLFAEGQRRYMESLSTYARQFMAKHEKPEVDEIIGICPTIALEQKNHTKNSRSTVGTATEIYDYLRILYSKLGQMFDPLTGDRVEKDVVSTAVEESISKNDSRKGMMFFPLEMSASSKISDRKRLLESLQERGFTKATIDKYFVEKKFIEVFDIQEEANKKKSPLIGVDTKANFIWVMIDRYNINNENRSRIADAMTNAYSEGFGRAREAVVDDDKKILTLNRYTEYPSVGDGLRRFPDMAPQLFSFNSPIGACPACKGFGNTLEIDINLVVPNPGLTLSQGAVEPLTKPSGKTWLRELLIFCQKEGISLNLPWKELKKKDIKKIWEGTDKFIGISGMFAELEEKKYKVQTRVFLSRYRSPRPCNACNGERLCPEARGVIFHGKNIGQLSAMTIEELKAWFEKQKLTEVEKEVSKDVLPQVLSRLEFLLRVGLGYLSLGRLAKTLSGGESQRIALANQLGSRLTQTCYVLDEPSIGLHPHDTERLIGILKELALLKNTVVVVEHDPDIIKSADYLIDIGPNAGENGGELLYQGPFKDFTKQDVSSSSTWAFLTQKEGIPIPQRRRVERLKDQGRRVKWLTLSGCTEHNLENVEVKVPLGSLTVVTGVSGSGKSTAIRKTLYPALARIFNGQIMEIGHFDALSSFESLRDVLMIDQSPIGRSSRSNPVTFMKAFDEVRMLFASTLEARKKNLHTGHFSFNVPGGRCDHCEGEGYQRVEMLFMEDMFVRCEHCDAKRFKKEILEVRMHGKNIDDVLNMTVSQARKFFVSYPKINKKLKTLERVGLGYLRLGQPSPTLSGGESQRLKIARELARVDNNGVFYVLDEPTTGLHFRDVKVLIQVLNELVEAGNTVLVIEHNLEVMKCADHIIDFGPGGGKHGGKVVDAGTPEQIVKRSKGPTATHLKPVLESSEVISVDDYLK